MTAGQGATTPAEARTHSRRRSRVRTTDGQPLHHRRFNKAAFYRQCRMLHTYLSAFAFLALIFFSLTGLLLNHPEWFGAGRIAAAPQTVTVPPERLAAALAAPEPTAALAAAVGEMVRLRGAWASGEIVDGEAFIRLEGVTGTSDLIVDLETGVAEVAVERATAVALINELHRGKNAGGVWSALIDVAAVLILVLSVLGYVLFFSLRLRVATSLKLTVLSLVAMVGIVWLFVP